jgi:predicted nuclease of predicted toxin-antitoxin system
MTIRIKFLADVNVEKELVDYLSGQGYDIKWIPDFDCEMLDEDLLRMANLEKRILITNDKDFGELIVLQRKLSTGVILFRVKGQRTQDKVKLMRKLLEKYGDKLLCHFVVATRNKFRFMPMEIVK